MELYGSDGQSLELEIIAYGFPEEETDKYDSNWLIIRISFNHPLGSWRAQDPLLLTYEVAQLADWLEAVGEGKGAANKQEFIEPNLKFRLVEGSRGPLLRMYFELEARPEWAPYEGAGEEDLWVEFLLSEVDLMAAAQSLREELRQYPQRAWR